MCLYDFDYGTQKKLFLSSFSIESTLYLFFNPKIIYSSLQRFGILDSFASDDALAIWHEMEGQYPPPKGCISLT